MGSQTEYKKYKVIKNISLETEILLTGPIIVTRQWKMSLSTGPALISDSGSRPKSSNS
jgi:hypothetical protein